MSSVPTSSDRSGVSSATASAMYWSMLFFDCTDELGHHGDRTGPVEPRRAGAHVDAAHVGVAFRRLQSADRRPRGCGTARAAT